MCIKYKPRVCFIIKFKYTESSIDVSIYTKTQAITGENNTTYLYMNKYICNVYNISINLYLKWVCCLYIFANPYKFEIFIPLENVGF